MDFATFHRENTRLLANSGLLSWHYYWRWIGVFYPITTDDGDIIFGRSNGIANVGFLESFESYDTFCTYFRSFIWNLAR